MNVYDTIYLIYNDGRGQGLAADLKFNVMGHLNVTPYDSSELMPLRDRVAGGY